MKSLVSLILFVILAFGVWLCTSSCTEYVFKNTTDTIFVDRPVNTLAPSFITVRDTVYIHIVDTVKVEVIIVDTVINNIYTTDTLIQVVTKDSIITKQVDKLVTVYQTVIQKDTIVVTDTVEIEVIQIEQRVIYLDTLYVLVETRQVFYVPDELMPYVSDFYTLAGQYGKEALGGMLLITYAKEEDLPGEGWTSSSFRHGWDYSQMIIQISEKVPHEQARSCIFREMARLQLKRKYTTTPDRIMNPTWPPDRTITQGDLDNLFNPFPI